MGIQFLQMTNKKSSLPGPINVLSLPTLASSKIFWKTGSYSELV